MFSRSIFSTATRACSTSFAPASRGATRQYSTAPKKGTQFLQPRNFIWVAAGGVAAAYGVFWIQGQDGFLAASKPLPPAEPTLKGDDQWVDLKLVKIEPYNNNTKKFIFELPTENHVSGLKTASAILTKYTPEGKKPIIRPYTPISDDDERGHLTLLVKQYPNGPMSTHIHEMNPEQRLLFKGPIPKYPWEANKHDHIALIAGGTGITPMWQLIRAIFKNKEDKTKVTLVFGNISEEDILLRHELTRLENEYPQRFRAFYTLDKAPKEWIGNTGFITKELLHQVLPEPKNENIKVFVCGPPGLMNHISGNKKSPKDQGDLVGILKELGYSKDQVYKF